MTTTDIIEEVTGPDEEPVTPAELASHLRLNTGEAEYDQLEVFITAARQQFEFSTDGRTVLPTTFRQHLTDWPEVIRLQKGKVTEVVSVTYFDEEDQEQELEGYQTDLTGIPALVYLPDGNYPALSPNKLRPITVEFIAGWESAEDVPQDVKLAIMLLAGLHYDNRESHQEQELKEVPMGFQRVCNKYRTGIVGW